MPSFLAYLLPMPIRSSNPRMQMDSRLLSKLTQMHSFVLVLARPMRYQYPLQCPRMLFRQDASKAWVKHHLLSLLLLFL